VHIIVMCAMLAETQVNSSRPTTRLRILNDDGPEGVHTLSRITCRRDAIAFSQSLGATAARRCETAPRSNTQIWKTVSGSWASCQRERERARL